MTRHACPRCMGSGAIALLTSMVVYFVCDQCGNRWRIAMTGPDVVDQPDRQTPA